MAKHLVASNATFIACGPADGQAQATFTDIYDTTDSTASAELVLNGNFSQLVFDLTNTGQNLTDFQMLGKVHRTGGWHVMITGATWNTVAGNLKEVVGTLNTLASGSAGMAHVETGPLYAVKFQAKIANGVRNKGTVTAAANPTNAKATNTLIITDTTGENFANGEEHVIGENTYTSVTALSEDPTVPFEVLIGADAAESMANFEAAINGDTGEGTLYSEGTTASEEVTAVASTDGDDEILTLTAIARGTGGNSIATTTDSSEAAFTTATLEGGTTMILTIDSEVFTFKHEDNVTDDNDVEIAGNASDTIDNFIAVYNAVSSRRLVAAVGAGDTMVMTAKDGITNAIGTAIGTTSGTTGWTWGATTLADAVMTSVAVNVIAMK